MFGQKSNFINLEFRTLEEIFEDKYISKEAKEKIKHLQNEDKNENMNDNKNKIDSEYIEEEKKDE